MCSLAILVKFNYYCLLIFVILIVITLGFMATFIQQIFIFNIYNSFSHDSFKKIAYCTELMVQYKCVAKSTVINEL